MKQFIVDAFTDIVFKGNPAAVCLVEQPLTDEQMQLIAIENNLSETAFVQAAADGNGFDLRWFTPGSEVDLCGHATLATAFVIFNECNFKESTIVFHTMSGDLFVNRVENGYEMTFPAYELTEVPVTAAMEAVLGVCPKKPIWDVTYFAYCQTRALLQIMSLRVKLFYCQSNSSQTASAEKRFSLWIFCFA